MRINSLVPELKQQVDDKKLPFNTAVELSFLKPQEQNKVVDFMKKEQVVPSMAQATALKEASRAAQEAQKSAPQNPISPAPKQPAPVKAPPRWTRRRSPPSSRPRNPRKSSTPLPAVS